MNHNLPKYSQKKKQWKCFIIGKNKR
jgi:hypothetical protein